MAEGGGLLNRRVRSVLRNPSNLSVYRPKPPDRDSVPTSAQWIAWLALSADNPRTSSWTRRRFCTVLIGGPEEPAVVSQAHDGECRVRPPSLPWRWAMPRPRV